MTEAMLVDVLGVLIGCNLKTACARRRCSVDSTIVAVAEAMIKQAKAIHEHQAIVGNDMVRSRILAVSVRCVGDFKAEIVGVCVTGGIRPATLNKAFHPDDRGLRWRRSLMLDGG